jgi:glucose/mannose-6-phosphate isomerase
MENLIHAFPQNILDALEIAKNAQLKKPVNSIQNIVICGMGGSGIGGKIAAQWVQNEIKVPITLASDYSLPAFVNEHSLVIGSSYSGNTEETLEAVKEAHQRNAHIIGISSGGELKAFCEKNNYDCIIVPGGNPPRSALAFSIVQLIYIFTEFGYISATFLDEFSASNQLLLKEKEEIHALAKEIAAFMFGKVGVIYSGPQYDSIAVRARQQFNENSKFLCWTHVIPEMNHNELVGWGGGDDRFAVLFLNTEDMYSRNQKRFEITTQEILKKGAKVMELMAKGNSQIQRSFYLINVVDWASFYLCGMNGADIIDIKVIDYLKNELANFK